MSKLHTFALCALAPLALAACGGMEEDTNNVALGLTSTGTVTEPFDRVELTLAGVDVHVATMSDDGRAPSEDGGAWLSSDAELGTVDLMKLRGGNRANLGELEAYGPITQVRLRVDPVGVHRAILVDGSSCPIDTSQIDPTGVKINHPFLAIQPPEEGQKNVTISLDVPASLVQTDTCAYALRPVLRLERVSP